MGLGSRILFEDEHCLALWKPAGQFTQGTWAPPGEQTLEQEVREHLSAADPASVYLGIVHRLDRPVSGVLLWARTSKAARRLSQQFERRKIEKEYWAIVEDEPGARSFGSGYRWTERQPAQRRHAGSTGSRRLEFQVWYVLLRPEPSGPARRSRDSAAKSCPASPRGCQWLRLWPETGRTHQLRVQAALRGLPVVGDGTTERRSRFRRGLPCMREGWRCDIRSLARRWKSVAPLPASWSELWARIDGHTVARRKPRKSQRVEHRTHGPDAEYPKARDRR